MYHKHGWIHLLKESIFFSLLETEGKRRHKITVQCITDCKWLSTKKERNNIFDDMAAKAVTLSLIFMTSLHFLQSTVSTDEL